MMTQPAPVLPSPSLRHAPDDRGLGGLVALVNGVERAFPLQDVRVRATIAGTCCRTVIEQRFANPLDQAMEAVHIFPLPVDGAVVEMELRAGDVVVRADVREREEAEKAFAEARVRGQRAALLTGERADIHTLRVTNLPPRTEVTVRLVIVERLDTIDGRVRWRFPTTIAPRYMPGTPIGHDGPGAVPDTDHVPDASRIQPPLRLAGGTRLDLEVRIEGAIGSLESSLHAIRLDLADGVRVAPAGTATLDRDFILSHAAGRPDTAALRAWTDGAHTLVVVDPPLVDTGAAMPRDAVFVLDISGSMSGSKMEAGKKALTTALHGLMPGDRFRLIAFDDRVEQFKKDFATYDEPSLRAADLWIGRLGARGGTEMLPAIQAALDGATPEGRLRTVLFVTDGQAGNADELVAAVANRRKTARFFTLGIDTAVNGALLTQLARVGGGVCELATPRDDIEAVVARIESRFGSPLADEVRAEGGEAARAEPAVLFSGRPVTLLLAGSPPEVRVTGRTPSGPLALATQPVRIAFPLGALWARERVAALEDRLTLRPFEAEAIRPEIVRIALAHRIASRFTAFIAVETHASTDGRPVEVVQPVELPAEWDTGAFLAQGAPSGPPPMKARMAPSPGSMARSRAPAAALMDESALDAPSPAPRASRPSGGSFGGRMMEAVRGLVAPPPPAAESGAVRQEEAQKLSKEKAGDPAGALARAQSADGSFGGDVSRTAAALLVLVLLGHTRRTGLRRRTVIKAAAWLSTREAHPHAIAALAALDAAERGETPSPTPEWSELARAGAEGSALAGVIAGA